MNMGLSNIWFLKEAKMGWIDGAVKEGVRQAWEDGVSKRCEGRDDPEDRCPMNPRQCVCWYVHSSKRPWWKKLLNPDPPRPPERVVFRRFLDMEISVSLEKAFIRKPPTPALDGGE
jgi:hypothetical protein